MLIGGGRRGHSCQAVPMGKGAWTQAERVLFNSSLPGPARPSLAAVASPWERRDGREKNPKEQKGAQYCSRGGRERQEGTHLLSSGASSLGSPGLSPRIPGTGQQLGREAGDQVLHTPLSRQTCPAHSPLLSWAQQPPTPVTTPANKTPPSWPLSLRAWTAAPQTCLQRSPTPLEED